MPVVAFSALAAPAALAGCSDNGNHHCYSIGESNGSFRGEFAVICETSMSVSNPNSDFVDNEMWADFSDGWTEAGMIYGNGLTPGFFWADRSPQYPGGSQGFNWHPIGGTPSGGTHYTFEINLAGQPQWAVTFFGNQTYYSYHNWSQFGTAQTGSEATANAANTTESGASQSLEYEDTNNNWWNGWPSVSQQVDGPSVGGPYNGFWYHSGTYWSEKTLSQGWSC